MDRLEIVYTRISKLFSFLFSIGAFAYTIYYLCTSSHSIWIKSLILFIFCPLAIAIGALLINMAVCVICLVIAGLLHSKNNETKWFS